MRKNENGQRVKKVVFVAVGFSGQGGSETVYDKVLNHYAKDDKLDLRLVTFGSMPASSWCTAPVAKRDFNGYKNGSVQKSKLKFMLALFWYFARVKADLVIYPSPGTLNLIATARKFNPCKFKLAAWVHFDLAQGVSATDRKMSNLLNYADAFISLSDSNLSALTENGFPENRIVTVYNSIERQVRSILPRADKVIFVYVGRLQFGNDTQKNNKEMFDALSALTEKFARTNWELHLFGAGKTAEEEKMEQAYVEKLGLSQQIFFHGWVKNPLAQLENASALLMTSTFEGFPMAVAESLSYGLPVVSSDINGPNELINADNGALYPLHQPEKLAQILQKFFVSADENSVSADRNFAAQVKNSIEQFYEEKFFERFDQVFHDKKM